MRFAMPMGNCNQSGYKIHWIADTSGHRTAERYAKGLRVALLNVVNVEAGFTVNGDDGVLGLDGYRPSK